MNPKALSNDQRILFGLIKHIDNQGISANKQNNSMKKKTYISPSIFNGYPVTLTSSFKIGEKIVRLEYVAHIATLFPTSTTYNFKLN